MNFYFQCDSCGRQYQLDQIRYRCDCGETLEVKRSDWSKVKRRVNKHIFENRLGSGVWRYRELLPPVEDKYIVSQDEGNTPLYFVGTNAVGRFARIDTLYLKHEGHNPTGSFKDRGMTVGISMAKKLGVGSVACASTGNTSSSLASYAAAAGLPCIVYLPKGKVSKAKLAQTVAYGAKIVEIEGDFDAAMKEVEEISQRNRIYLLNSINPFRIEGQKTIAYELLQQLGWKAPDWIVVPGGNLGNTAAIGKAVIELFQLGFINRIPRIVTVQARGASPFYRSFKKEFRKRYTVKAETVASAIRIGNPVSFEKAKRIIKETNGHVEEVTGEQILEAKSVIDRCGIGCEPASATTVAGIKKLVKKEIVKPNEVVVGILTGHILKDPLVSLYTNRA